MNNDRKKNYEFESEIYEKFKKIFSHAYNHSKYLNKKYSISNINPSRINSINDISKIPILKRSEIKNYADEILTVSLKKNFINSGATGGSTGFPLKYYHDKRVPVEAFSWRYLYRWGIKPWNSGAYLWRMKNMTKFSKMLNFLLWWPTKKIRLDATLLNDSKFDFFIGKINKHKPKIIQGYVGAIFEFAKYIKINNIYVNSPKFVWVTSAPLSIHHRNIIENCFGCPVMNEYGSSEIPWIAAQKHKDSPMFINTEGRYLELINIDESGYGDVIITDLLNFSFPLIRYELGDRAKFVKIDGKNHLAIEAIKGRSGDEIEIPNFGKLDSSYLTTIFDEFPSSIESFQIVQKKNFDIILRVVPSSIDKNNLAIINSIKKQLEKKIQNKVSIDLDLVDQINNDRGKTRYIIKE